MRLTTLWFALLLLPPSLLGRLRGGQPVVSYTLTVDSGRVSGFRIVMKIRNAPDTLRLALARHTEYDEQFWKNLKDLRVESRGAVIPVVREDSAIWRAATGGGDATIRYRFELKRQAGPVRRSWRVFLSETGGLVGGVQSFLYLVGNENAPARVRIEVPRGWEIATGLPPASGPGTFNAANVDELVDSPLLIGKLRTWRFAVDGVPHRVVYWPLPDAVPFDTTTLVSIIERIVRAAVAIFGSPGYREYVFLIQDGADDALEHLNSLTIGAQSAGLAKDFQLFAGQLAHEFFHTWNLVRIRPREQTFVTYKPPTPTPALWWSEGVTLYYANKLMHRAGLLDSASMRTWLAEQIAGYYQNQGNARISPETASLGANEPVSSDSGYRASYYTQGTLFGQLLDLAIRDSTGLRRGLDDVMHEMNAGFSRTKGFTDEDIEKTAGAVCGCNVHEFFEAHIRGTRPLNIEPFLNLIGLQADINRVAALDSSGRPLPDLRVFGTVPEGSGKVQIIIYGAPNCWWRSGLRTGDAVIALGGRKISAAGEFREILAQQRVGDSLAVDYLRAGEEKRAIVRISGYTRTNVELHEVPGRTPVQAGMYRLWADGAL